MKIINLDELEKKCLEFGIKNGFFDREDLEKDNLVKIQLNGKLKNKQCDICFSFKDISKNSYIHLYVNQPIIFKSESWENLYSQLDIFFRETWNYIEDNKKMPLYMKIAELIGKKSKNGFVNASEINQEIQKLL
jgi:hypothetical protein